MSMTAEAFPQVTAWSVVLGARDRTSLQGRERWDALVAVYWRPVWAYLVRRWGCTREDAEDLAQEFFSRLVETGALDRASPERGRFRTFLKLELRNLVIDDFRRRTAQKRGGGADPRDLETLERLAHPGATPEEEFERAWAATLLVGALEELRGALEEKRFRAYWACDVADPPQPYAETARELGVSANDVGNYVFRARAELREILLRKIRESVEREEDAEDELAHLLKAFRP